MLCGQWFRVIFRKSRSSRSTQTCRNRCYLISVESDAIQTSRPGQLGRHLQVSADQGPAEDVAQRLKKKDFKQRHSLKAATVNPTKLMANLLGPNKCG